MYSFLYNYCKIHKILKNYSRKKVIAKIFVYIISEGTCNALHEELDNSTAKKIETVQKERNDK